MNAKLKIFSAIFLVAAQFVRAQTTMTQQRPNVTNRTLITKATPPEKTTPKQYTIEQFMATMRVGGSAFSADEKSILFHSNKTGIFNVYSVPVSGGDAKQLTNSTKESTYIVAAFPNDARFLYRHDRGGNENEHLYLRELDGTEHDLTPGEKTKANFLGWSFDRQSFFCACPPQFMHEARFCRGEPALRHIDGAQLSAEGGMCRCHFVA